MSQPDLPSHADRFGIVILALVVAFAGRYFGGFVQWTVQSLFAIAIVLIAAYLFRENTLAEKSRRRLLLVLIGLGGGVGILN